MKTLLSSLQALQVLHHLLHVVLGVTVLDIGEPAATHADDDGHDQHEVFQVVMTVHCEEQSAGSRVITGYNRSKQSQNYAPFDLIQLYSHLGVRPGTD